MSAILAEAFTTWRECRDDYERHLLAQYDEAERETRGNLLNARGRAKGIAADTLFLGPEYRAFLYASDELVDYWRTHERLTFAEFERRWRRSVDPSPHVERWS